MRETVLGLVAAVRNNMVLWIAALLILLFAYFVWPTPYRYHQISNSVFRQNRITGTVEELGLDADGTVARGMGAARCASILWRPMSLQRRQRRSLRSI